MTDHGISTRQLATIASVLQHAGDRITRVDLFGSRAIGTHRANSDIDLVVEGAVSDALVERLSTLFQESSLPVSVDVIHYERAPRPLQEHIDAVRRPLWRPRLAAADLRGRSDADPR